MGLGLCASLFIRRRRVWVRVEPERRTEEVTELAYELRERYPAVKAASPDVNTPEPLHQEQK